MKNNIALIGFMGAGKTVTGRALARLLKMDFVDTDDIVEQAAGMNIAEIFAGRGEKAFREMEKEAVRQACSRNNTVIACGGGAVLRPENTALLKKTALVIYLEARPGTILQRLDNSGTTRPLLNISDPATAVAAMLAEREPLYNEAAEIIIDTTGLNAESVAQKIISGLSKHESFNLQKQHTR